MGLGVDGRNLTAIFPLPPTGNAEDLHNNEALLMCSIMTDIPPEIPEFRPMLLPGEKSVATREETRFYFSRINWFPGGGLESERDGRNLISHLGGMRDRGCSPRQGSQRFLIKGYLLSRDWTPGMHAT